MTAGQGDARQGQGGFKAIHDGHLNVTHSTTSNAPAPWVWTSSRACAPSCPNATCAPFLYQHLLQHEAIHGLSSAASTRMLARRLGMAALVLGCGGALWHVANEAGWRECQLRGHAQDVFWQMAEITFRAYDDDLDPRRMSSIRCGWSAR